MGWPCPPYYGKKKSDFYKKKKAHALKIVAKQNIIIEECDKQLAIIHKQNMQHINEQTANKDNA